jgi:LemA protein
MRSGSIAATRTPSTIRHMRAFPMKAAQWVCNLRPAGAGTQSLYSRSWTGIIDGAQPWSGNMIRTQAAEAPEDAIRIFGLPPRRFTALIFVLLSTLFLAGCGINTLPTLEERAKGSWSEVQNQYQRRSDLIPNLVETVRGYAQQEREVLTQVIEARAKATQVQVNVDQITDPDALRRFQEAQQQLSGALGRLIAVSENYPDLKSNQNFLALQSQLEGTENRIAVARRDYIQAVQAYNTEVRTFPGRLWAMVYGSKPMATFTAPEDQQRPPPVKF